MAELLPCPFCGSGAEIVVREFTDDKANYGEAYASCLSCGIEQPYKQTEAEAIAAWNTRALQPTSERERIVAWMRSWKDAPEAEAVAAAIERGDWESGDVG
jgi:Lar family restriction alleviation protein